MKVVFKTTYAPSTIDAVPLYGDHKIKLMSPSFFSDSRMVPWFEEHGVDWKNSIGLTIREWKDGNGDNMVMLYAKRLAKWKNTGIKESLIETWIEFEDPSLATLFKLKWC